MGLIAKILSFARVKLNGAFSSDVKVDPGGGANITLHHFADAGDDSQPLPGDYVAAISTQQEGSTAAVGYLDPNNQQVALPGEKRIYARDEDGNVVVELHLKNDKTAELFNALGKMILNEDGSFNINGMTIDKDGAIVTPKSITTPSAVIAGIEHATHIHSTPAGPSGPPEGI